MTPRLVLITDRRLMRGGFANAIAEAVRLLPARSAIVQVREKDLGGAQLLRLVREAIAAAPEQLVVVNDRLDVALAAAAAGVHLPEDGLDVRSTRDAIAAVDGPSPCADAPPVLVGCSRHAADSAARAADSGADYVHLGPVWSTPSKDAFGAPLGTEVLRAARAQMNARCLLVAVGGVDSPARAALARSAGADAVAVIRAVWCASDPAMAARSMT